MKLTAEQDERLRQAARKRKPLGNCLCRTCRCGRCEMHRVCPHSPLYGMQARIEAELYGETGVWYDLSSYGPQRPEGAS